MATNLGKAYVQIVPSAEGIQGSISNVLKGESASAGKESGESIGSNLVGMIKKVVAAAGIGAAIKTALNAGSNVQQSFGGIETIYAEASDKAKQYAKDAAAAGISANTYAEQAVSFGVALKNSLGGDAVAAADAANLAINDMADNSAKMGTNIKDIQNAYQGFAKGNYTMLDNLKLGYGGTKEGMQQLLDKANELNKQQGINTNYSMDSFADIVNAIHTVQDNLNIAGVAAAEAQTTFSGSLGGIKASAENLMAALTLGMDLTQPIQQLTTSITNFVFGNLIPMLTNLVILIPVMVQTIISTVGAQISSSAPEIIGSVTQIFDNVINFLTAQLPQLLSEGTSAVSNFASGILEGAPEVITNIGGIVNQLLDTILTAIPGIINNGSKLISNFANSVSTNGPQVISAIGNVVANLLQTILSHLPDILQAGVKLILSMSQGIVQNAPQAVNAIVQVIGRLLVTIAQNLPQILQKGIELIGQLAAGIIRAIPSAVATIPKLINGIKSAFTGVDWGSIGKNIVDGIARGLSNAAGRIASAAKEAANRALNAAKNFLGIHSPSTVFRDQVGKYMALGMAEGFENNIPTREMNAALSGMTGQMSAASQSAGISYGGFNINVYAAPGQSAKAITDEVARRIQAAVDRKKAVFA